MILLILGLILFLGIHTIQIAAPAQREAMIARMGLGPFRGLYSLVSIVGFVLIIWGFGLARADTVGVWSPPVWTRHLAIALNLVAFILLAVYGFPAGRIKAAIGHPMVTATVIWSAAHLLANGTLADIVLFGAFFVWAGADLVSLYARDRAEGIVRQPKAPMNDLYAVILGVVLWAVFLLFLHRWLFGVSPLG